LKFAYDVPGYVTGHRFSQDRRCYDAANQRFLDLAGFNRFGNHVAKTSGTPAFSTHGPNAREGLLLNNSNQWEFVNPVPWQGTMLMVMKPHFPTGSATLMTYLFGDASVWSSNGLMILQTNAGGTVVNANYGTVTLSTGQIPFTQDTIFIVAASLDQETRKAYYTKDGAVATESAAAAASSNGNAAAIGWNGDIGLAGTRGSRMVRMGNNSGTIGDTAANATNYAWIFEHHFWKGNVLKNNLGDLKAFIDTLKVYYGVV
jgi:hypothetical protein